MTKRLASKSPMCARQLLLLGACAFGVAGGSSSLPAGEPRPVVFHEQTMGTRATLTLVAADSAAVAGVARRSMAAFHRVDSLMSNWTDASEVARINREEAAGDIEIHADVCEVLDIALRIGRESNGAFDVTVEPLVRLWGFIGGPPRVPSQSEIDGALEFIGQENLILDAATQTLHIAKPGVKIDLGGIAKGFAVDRVASSLRGAGVTDALVDLSGNMVAMGSAAGKDGWTLGVRDPSGQHAYLARVILYDEAVATSGDYEQFVDAGGKRHGHILDPRTGWSARGLKSVTVIADRAVVCDAWATALFVLGPSEARRVARERKDFSVILLEPAGDGNYTAWVEEGIKSRFFVAAGTKDRLTVRYF